MQNKFLTVKIFAGILCTCLLLGACEEKIDLDLRDAGPQIVIEGNLNDQNVPATVIVQQTTSFSDTLFFNGLTGAVVTITHSNITDTLSEIQAGIYVSPALHAQAGETYRLKVEALNKVFEATSVANAPVPIDSVYTTVSTFGNNERLACAFRDPANVPNYYRAMHSVHGNLENGIHCTSDEFTDGKNKTIRMGGADDLVSGDTVNVYLYSIDRGVFLYFESLDESGGIVAPANPVSNISNGALGYFNAYTVSVKQYIFP